MKKMNAAFLLGALGLVSYGSVYAQAAPPTCNSSGCTISMSGSYLLTGSINGLTISANNVVVDLGGFTVTQNPMPAFTCNIVAGTRGNSCTGNKVGNPAITINGVNVTVKNGMVSNGYGIGILANPPANTNSNLTLQDITVSNFNYTGIDISLAGVARLINVQANQNGTYGILGQNGAMLTNVTANYNNSTGIQLNSGVIEDATANYNKGAGIVSAGTITKAHTENNGTSGIIGAAVIRDSYALGNVSDGVAAGSWGVVYNTVSALNGGRGFAFSATGVCYWGLSTASNTGVAISGGTPLTGSTASCQ